ncbi:MAG: riboflavin synthase [Arcticibacterium sp.]|jgi:riboflavin synthase
MFTGIVESRAKVVNISQKGRNKSFTLKSDIAHEFHVDQSISHNGVCLTVERIHKDSYQVTAIDETLIKTNLGSLKANEDVNLERCLKADGRFDGHIVQGHVDEVGTLESIDSKEGSYVLRFSYRNESNNITVEKGSICINGISLTVFDSEAQAFSVAVIPYTWENTNLQALNVGDNVNLEFDILGKYMQRILQNRG